MHGKKLLYPIVANLRSGRVEGENNKRSHVAKHVLTTCLQVRLNKASLARNNGLVVAGLLSGSEFPS